MTCLEKNIEMFFLIILIISKNGNTQQIGGCNEIPASLTSPKTGQKAWDKCIEYQERYVYPCEVLSVSEPARRGNYCEPASFSIDPRLTQTENNDDNYVVSLGAGVESNIRWICAGIIISEKYILATTSCTAHVTFVYLGGAVPRDAIDFTRLYRVKNIIKHPESTVSLYDHEVTLIETEELYTLNFNHNIRPACLHTGQPLNYDQATYISRRYYITSDHLKKFDMKIDTGDTCIAAIQTWKKNADSNYVKRGPVMCYIDSNNPDSSFRFDYGSPLQVMSDKISCMNVVIGIKSMKPRSQVHIFTRISNFLPWIESIVWA